MRKDIVLCLSRIRGMIYLCLRKSNQSCLLTPLPQPNIILTTRQRDIFVSSRGARGQFCQYWNFMETVPALAFLGQIVSWCSSSRGEFNNN